MKLREASRGFIRIRIFSLSEVVVRLVGNFISSLSFPKKGTGRFPDTQGVYCMYLCTADDCNATTGASVLFHR